VALTVTSRGTGTHNTGATTLVPGGRSATLAVGSLGVLCIAVDNAGGAGDVIIAPTSWTDAKGNVWTRRTSALYDNGAASAGIEMAFYTAPITVALLTTDLGTITWNTGVSPVAKAWTWYEVIPSNGITPVYLNGASIAGATAANAQVITAESINIGDAVIAGYFSENVAAVTQDSDTTNGSWTAQQTATIGTTTSGVRIATQQKVQTTAASTQSYDVTVSSQDRIAGYISVREVQAKTPQPTAASLTTSGATPTVVATDNKASVPGLVALTTSLATPTVTTTANVISVPTVLALTVTGSIPAVATPVATAPPSVSLTLTPSTPAVVTPVTSQPAALTLTTSAGTPVVQTPVQTSPGAASLSLSFGTPAIVQPIASAPDAASLSVSTATPAISLPITVAPDEASLTTSLETPNVTLTDNISASVGAESLTLTTSVPAIGLPKSAAPSWISLIISAGTPSVIVTTPGSYIPFGASLHLAGATPIVKVASAQPEQRPAGTFRPLTWNPKAVPSAASLALTFGVPDVQVTNPNEELELELVALGFV